MKAMNSVDVSVDLRMDVSVDVCVDLSDDVKRCHKVLVWTHHPGGVTNSEDNDNGHKENDHPSFAV